jgi:hypothetical protein
MLRQQKYQLIRATLKIAATRLFVWVCHSCTEALVLLQPELVKLCPGSFIRSLYDVPVPARHATGSLPASGLLNTFFRRGTRHSECKASPVSHSTLADNGNLTSVHKSPCYVQQFIRDWTRTLVSDKREDFLVWGKKFSSCPTLKTYKGVGYKVTLS